MHIQKIGNELDMALEEGWSAATVNIRKWVEDNRPRWGKNLTQITIFPKTWNY